MNPLFSFGIVLALIMSVGASENRADYGAGLSAMGGSAVAVMSEDAVTVNPSSLAFMEDYSLVLSGNRSLEKKHAFQSLGIAPIKKAGFAFGYGKTTVSEIPLRDGTNRPLGTSEFFSQKISLGAGIRAGRSFAVGTSLHRNSLGLEGESFQNRWSIDLGALAQRGGWNFGFSFLGWGGKKNSEARFGIAKQTKAKIVSSEIVWPLDAPPYFAVSMELPLAGLFLVRTVYHSGPQDFKRAGILPGFSAGFGFRIGRVFLDYGFVPETDLGFSHKFSLTIKARRETRSNQQTGETKSSLSKNSAEGNLNLPGYPSPDVAAGSGVEAGYFQQETNAGADWQEFVRAAHSRFAVLAHEIEAREEEGRVLLNLNGALCEGAGKFSARSGFVLAEVGKFLRSYPLYPLWIEGRGFENDRNCAESVKAFLYNEGVDSSIGMNFTFGERSLKIVILKNTRTDFSFSVDPK